MKNLFIILFAFTLMVGVAVAEDAPEYAFSKTVELSFDEAIEKVTADLKNVGFGIITEIDVQATMQKRLGEEMKPYKILGACNPKFAHQVLQLEPQLGLFLPCNVIVYVDENDKTVVSAVDPLAMMAAVDNEELESIALAVKEKLKSAIDNL